VGARAWGTGFFLVANVLRPGDNAPQPAPLEGGGMKAEEWDGCWRGLGALVTARVDRLSIEVAERFAEGLAGRKELAAARRKGLRRRSWR
jgi:hypothetical protein